MTASEALWEVNWAALQRFQPDAARQLAALGAGAERGEWSASRFGLPTVRRDGLSLVSAYDPVAEAARALPEDDADALVLPGLGAGYLAEAAAARFPGVPLVIAEADVAWFREVLHHRDLRALWPSPGVVVLLGPDARTTGEFLANLACRSVCTLKSRPLVERDPAWYEAISAQVAAAQARARVNLATFQRFGTLWRRNLRRNEASAVEVRPVQDLAGLWKGGRAVIAAAGPSLADAFAWMEAHRHRYGLIAVDTAWPALAARGLTPDVLVVMDGQYANARHLDRVPPAATLVVTEWTGPPRAFRLAPGRTYVAATSLPLLRRREEALWGRLGVLPSGGSVATAAWSLALSLGCREVAFAGLDLGYPRGQTHVPGSQFEEALHRSSGRLAPAETGGLRLRGWEGLAWRPALDGGQVLSDPRMDLFRDWLAAAVAARPDVRAVNLGRRGSVVPGLEPAPADYGHLWPTMDRRSPDVSSPLVRHDEAVPRPPFAALESVLSSSDFPRAVDEAWAAARAYWGAEVWDRWAGRARSTWDRFPTGRSRRAVEELVATTLPWREFWDRA